MSEAPGPELLEAVARGAGLSPETSARALLAGLWTAVDGERDDEEAALGTAKRLGAEGAEAGEALARTVARVLSLGRALGERAAQAGAREAAARLGPLVDAAAAAAATGWEEARTDRREAWLSLLTHDLKGRLNVVNLNLWLLRQGRSLASRDAEKHEKIERAIARILEVVKDMRDLHARSLSPIPSHKSRI